MSPSGGYSGLWRSLSNADLALSVAITTASTVACSFILPLNLYIYVEKLSGLHVHLDWMDIILAVVVVICAVTTGLTIATRWPQRRGIVNKAGMAAGGGLMVLSLFANSRSHDPIWTKPFSWFAACSLPCAVGLCATVTIARLLRLPPPEATAVAIECVYQNTALALSVALSAFPDSKAGEAAGVPLVYGFAEIVFIALFAVCAWQLGWTYAPRQHGLCAVLLGNYQPGAVDSTLSAPLAPDCSEEAAMINAVVPVVEPDDARAPGASER